MKNLLIIGVLLIGLSVNLFAKKYPVSGYVSFNDLTIANTFNNFIVNKSSLMWSNTFNVSFSNLTTYVSTSTVYILTFKAILNVEGNRDTIENKVKDWFQTYSTKVVAYEIYIIEMGHDENPTTDSEILRRYRK